MRSRSVSPLPGALVVLMFAVALATIFQLPDDSRIAVHWGADGAPDGWMGKWPGMLFIPLVSSVVWCSTRAATLPRLHTGSPASAILLVALIGECLIAATALGYAVHPIRTMYVSVGVFFLALGAMFGALARHSPSGMTLPSSLTAAGTGPWHRIHTACRWIFSACGIGIVITALVSSDPGKPAGALWLIVVAPALAILYAYLAWRHPPA